MKNFDLITILRQRNYQAVLCVCVALYGLYLRVMSLAGRELWMDEYHQFSFIQGPFKAFWRHYTYGDHASFPGEYLLTYFFVQIFGFHKWGLAIPHIITTVAGFYFLFLLCRRHFDTAVGYAVTFTVVCLNRNLIFHSFEFRPYAVLPTLALGSLYFADLLFREYGRITPAKRFLIGLFFVAAVNFHAYGILIALLPVVYTFLSLYFDKAQKISFKGPLQYFAAVMAVAVPIWCWYASSNHFGMAPTAMIQGVRGTFDYIPNPLVNTLGFIKGILGNLLGNRIFYVFLIGVFPALFVSHKYRAFQLAFLGVLIVLPIGLILFVDIKAQYWFLQRQFVWVMPLFAFFLGWCWEAALAFFIKSEKGKRQF